MPIWSIPDAYWASSRALVLTKASASSSTGPRRFMDVSPERLVEQANERFQLQDYYGAIHLLEEVIATGRAFADAHHLLGLSYSLAGQPDKALEQLDRALALNPNYIEALIHRALVLNELGREEEANAVLRRARQVGAVRRAGFPAHIASKLANQHAELGEAYLEAGGLNEAIAQYEAALALGPAFHDLRYKLGRLLLEAGRALEAHEHFQTILRGAPIPAARRCSPSSASRRCTPRTTSSRRMRIAAWRGVIAPARTRRPTGSIAWRASRWRPTIAPR